MVEEGIIISLIIAISEMVKTAADNKIVNKLIPVLNLILGLAAAFVYLDVNPEIAVFEGIKMGLIASGLYSGTKNVVQGIKEA